MRRRNQCRYCSGHGRHMPAESCRDCGALFCVPKHGGWFDDRWLCAGCQRRLAK